MSQDDPITPPHPLPEPLKPTDALITLVRLQGEHLQEIKQLREELEEQRLAVEQMKEWMSEYLDNQYKELPRWYRMRTYIEFAFWLLIGIPVILACLLIAFLATGYLSWVTIPGG
jgi:hypothetical protein